MRTKLSAIMAICLVILGTSCTEEDIKELLQSDVPISLSNTYSLDLDTDVSFEKTEDFSTSFAGLSISAVEISVLTVEIENYVSSATGITLDLTFTIAGSNASIVLTGLDPAALEGQTIDLATDAASAISAFESYLLANPDATMTLSGTVSGTPVSFDLTSTINMTVTTGVE